VESSKKFLTYLLLIILLAGGLAFLESRLATFVKLSPSSNPQPVFSTTPTPIETCPTGYILVPGNPEYGTSDFCVMKYDAKCTNTDPKCVTSEGVYKNNRPGCECQGSFSVVSTMTGAPITYIPEDDGTNVSAKAYCRNAGGHLITNNEWMSIARNVEKVNENWCNSDGTGCGNTPGTPGKILANGHNDDVPSRALASSSDDKPCFGTTSDGSNVCGGKSSQKRTLTLTNGNVIWDFAGNVWTWVDAEIERRDEPHSITPGEGGMGWVWAEFQTVPYDSNLMPENPAWNSTQGVGRIYHYNLVGDTDTTIYTYIRGGNWRHGHDSGAFTVHMSPEPSRTNIDDVGFRCVTSPE